MLTEQTEADSLREGQAERQKRIPCGNGKQMNWSGFPGGKDKRKDKSRFPSGMTTNLAGAGI
jgi:hypothetical protein